MKAVISLHGRWQSKLNSWVLIGCTALCLIAQAGCGWNSDDPRSIHIEGTITINGKPIVNGKISFTPDSRKGNTGPMGVAKIKNGEFNTHSVGGRPVIGGPHIVEIENFVFSGGDTVEDVLELEQVDASNPEKPYFEDWDIPRDQSPIERDFKITR